jgi:Lon protease-like protein
MNRPSTPYQRVQLSDGRTAVLIGTRFRVRTLSWIATVAPFPTGTDPLPIPEIHDAKSVTPIAPIAANDEVVS